MIFIHKKSSRINVSVYKEFLALDDAIESLGASAHHHVYWLNSH